MTARPALVPEEDSGSHPGTEFAGVVLLTATLADVVDELRRLNMSLDMLIELESERREGRLWRITRRR